MLSVLDVDPTVDVHGSSFPRGIVRSLLGAERSALSGEALCGELLRTSIGRPGGAMTAESGQAVSVRTATEVFLSVGGGGLLGAVGGVSAALARGMALGMVGTQSGGFGVVAAPVTSSNNKGSGSISGSTKSG